ncbi:hypothetical protein K461DRAFT_329757 [Myriangium duriaei CBS 260.36]|uniref:Golgi apyrase n=1 Tax=Myriangium duriaei CBS 260.36 TaxID=1168546 RepID=A0A9P4IY81_9PEZI|nr:hypothetical protein K461DRAFT_329757 [Myriangium duriaei CBS 260.36]
MGKWRWGVILDAGSSGTRVYVYRWLKPKKALQKADDEELNRLPELHTKKKWTKKIKPGLSTFGETPELVGSDHLRELMRHALDVIPEDDVEDTPIFLLATAGMRLLPDHQRQAVLANVCSYLQKDTKFQLPDCNLHIQVIPGSTEGLYGWIAANYLLGGFDATIDHGHGHHTYGFLDMGGASAQIAFAPNNTVAESHGNDLTLLRLRTVGGKQLEYRVFVTTWLEYGVNEARRRFINAMIESSPQSLELPDPCLPAGLIETKSGEVLPPSSKDVQKETYLLGTGKFTECLKQTYPLLDKDAPCTDEPCLSHGVHVPPVDFKVNHFVGVSEYWHTTHSVFEGKDAEAAYDLKTYQAKVEQFCSQDWEAIQSGVTAQKWGKKVDERTAAEVCFKASWLINMLHDGIGIPRAGLEMPSGEQSQNVSEETKEALKAAKDRGLLDSFHAVDKIDGTELSWTLGKMVLYAASQHPPSDKAMAVGFGSNIAGNELPKDFQFPSINSEGVIKSTDDLDWHDRLFASASDRRVPGFIFFFVILGVVGFLLCGRERRQAFMNRLSDPFGRNPPSSSWSAPKRKRGLLNRILSRGPKYDKITTDLEDDFELGHVSGSGSDSDSDGGPGGSVKSTSSSRASGLATPKLLARKSYFDGLPQRNLSARNESRERLGLGVITHGVNSSGNRSRHTSPVRRASPLTPFKTSID